MLSWVTSVTLLVVGIMFAAFAATRVRWAPFVAAAVAFGGLSSSSNRSAATT